MKKLYFFAPILIFIFLYLLADSAEKLRDKVQTLQFSSAIEKEVK